MVALNGKISDKIRRLLTTDEILSNPHPDRGASPTPKKKLKKDSGQQLSKADRKAK